MARTNSGGHVSTLQLIAVPALITLAITVLRLIGERQGWSKVWFNPAPAEERVWSASCGWSRSSASISR